MDCRLEQHTQMLKHEEDTQYSLSLLHFWTYFLKFCPRNTSIQGVLENQDVWEGEYCGQELPVIKLWPIDNYCTHTWSKSIPIYSPSWHFFKFKEHLRLSYTFVRKYFSRWTGFFLMLICNFLLFYFYGIFYFCNCIWGHYLASQVFMVDTFPKVIIIRRISFIYSYSHFKTK
jgi:hypothetical protein